MGCAPFGWQKRLYQRLIRGEVRNCDIPTGLGKTAVIAVWLFALAKAPAHVPRRLIYIVNRRTVVDQATKIAADLRELLNNSHRARDRQSPRGRRLRVGYARHRRGASGRLLWRRTLDHHSRAHQAAMGRCWSRGWARRAANLHVRRRCQRIERSDVHA